MSSQVKIQDKKRGRRSWPVMGFLLIVAFTVIAYLIAPGVIDWLRDNLRGFRTTGMNQTTLRWVFTAIIAPDSLAVRRNDHRRGRAQEADQRQNERSGERTRSTGGCQGEAQETAAPH
ncbi:MAG: hypothetical protein IPK17_24535 [Chloroflexi bacterium]|uniref:hypothetical protein n=1 Tax=Candidatus Flexifilum breve TaxID=3140694 RepID=UPI0031357CC4|nr:hypothetical protein [Chloroflexota bacterium]